MLLPDPPLRDDRVALRAWRRDDVPAIVAGCRDPLVQLWTRVPRDYGEDDARAFVAGAARGRMLGEALDLAIADPADDRVLGAVGLLMDRHDGRRAEIGYWVAAAERGRGVARRACGLLSRWALGPGGLERLDLQASVANPASLRVAERCGFVREGTMRAAWYRGPSRTDMALFSLLPSDLGRRGA
ncbi:GNAT family N-acetyltransferase [Miltoncostaea marina]|uniref:GNAT family N-acetyltransferase n=1 Tax=Miltoncostaea marina TaxID=2843215 RepID=UPI001C3DCA82|nr:GNAT family protein [Miltoncostaea marina]